MSIPMVRCLSCDSINPPTAKFCSECGADLQSGSPTIAIERRPPSFANVMGTVWKVLMAILLIPFLLLLAYISFEVIVVDHLDVALAVGVAVAVTVGFVWLRRR